MLQIVIADLSHKIALRGQRVTAGSIVRILFAEGSVAQIIYRLMRLCDIHRLRPLAFAFYRLNALLSNIVIGRGAEFGPGLVIMHTFGTVINGAVRGGRNVVLEHGVTIGESGGRSPELGDNIYIGAGAKVIGGVRVGSDVKIGANAVVTQDIPDGATAVGVPARVVRIYGERIPSGVVADVDDCRPCSRVVMQ